MMGLYYIEPPPPPPPQWVRGDSPQTFLSFYTLPFYSVINWLHKLHGLVVSFLQLPHPPFHSNASNYCFSSVALQYGFRRTCEFHHVFGVDSSYGSYPSLDVTWENRDANFQTWVPCVVFLLLRSHCLHHCHHTKQQAWFHVLECSGVVADLKWYAVLGI